MKNKSKDNDKNPINEFASTFISDPGIRKKSNDMFDRELDLASIDELFDDSDNSNPKS